MAIRVLPSYPNYRDTTGGPLENGYIYIGTAGADAETNLSLFSGTRVEQYQPASRSELLVAILPIADLLACCTLRGLTISV